LAAPTTKESGDSLRVLTDVNDGIVKDIVQVRQSIRTT
jgi:hypothetical protein